MPYRKNTFHKMVAVIGLLLLPIIVMYGYSHQISIQVVEKQLTEDSLDKLHFLLNELEGNVDQLAKLTVILANDFSIKSFVEDNKQDNTLYSSIKRKTELMDILNLYSLTSNWQNEFTLYSSNLGQPLGIDNYSPKPYNREYLKQYATKGWCYIEADHGVSDSFIRLLVQPAPASENIDKADYVVETRFSAKNIVYMLDQYQQTGNSDPFLYYPGLNPIYNQKSDKPKIGALIEHLKSLPLSAQGNITFKIDGKPYLISYYRSNSLGWYLVDYVPLQEIVSPIKQSRNFFYIGIAFLIVMSIILTYMLYRNVQVPIRELIQNLQKLKRGDYSARLTLQPANEFAYLFGKFNEMAEQIQDLIEKVFTEQLRTKEATLKQLQSQINPHFLYNCLFFIVGSARLRDHETVEAMAQNLGDYYRYSTRLEKDRVTVNEELDLVVNYLEIQNMRMQRLEYEIIAEEQMENIPIPRLLLQPVVENAIVHGIEPLEGNGIIRITLGRSEAECRIEIEDNGIGMSKAAIESLSQRLSLPISEDIGFALWNVHQRLVTLYGEQSGIRISGSELGGLKVVLHWQIS